MESELARIFRGFDVEKATANLIVFAVAIFLTAAALALASRLIRRIEKSMRLNKQALIPLRMSVRYAILLAAATMTVTALGYDIGNFWTLLSTILGLIAIGFVAVWSVLSNVSSTFLIFSFKPFRVGDYVALVGDDTSGQVVDVNFMFTTLRRKDGDLFRVPNNQFFQKSVQHPRDPDAFEAGDSDDDKSELKSTDEHRYQNLEGLELETPKAR